MTERTRALIQRKIEGEEIMSNLVEEPRAQVIDLMEALKASLAKPRAKSSSSSSSSSSTAKTSGPTRIPAKAEAKRTSPVQKVAKTGSRSR